MLPTCVSWASCHSNGLVAPLMFLLSSLAGSAHLTHHISSQSSVCVCVCSCTCVLPSVCVCACSGSTFCLRRAAVSRCVGWWHRGASVCVCVCVCVTVSQRYTLLIWQPTAEPITYFLSLPISMWGCRSKTSSGCGGRHADGEDRMDTHIHVAAHKHTQTTIKHWLAQYVYQLPLDSLVFWEVLSHVQCGATCWMIVKNDGLWRHQV